MKRKFYLFVLSALLLAFTACADKGAKVTLTEDAETYTMDNGIVTAVVAKASGDLVSLRYQGKEMLATFLTEDGKADLQKDPPGANPNGLNRGMTDHQYGFWSHDAMGPRDTRDAIATVTINPRKNGGRRAEVSVKGISEGRKMGTGPGASQDGQFASDIEIRYTLEKGLPGVYTYCYFVHPESYPYTQLGEARFCAKLAPFFDWMSVDEKVDFHYPKDYYAGDKYVYTSVLYKNRAFGWSSTTDSVGFYLINPSMEYMSSGPTKVEFMGHRDTNSEAAPCVLNYWRSSHYGGAEVNVAAGERWEKVVGPFLLYVNTGATPAAMYADAKAQAEKEAAKWPFDWVSGVDYPKKAQRATVSGKFELQDPLAPASFTNLQVGLCAPLYESPRDPASPMQIPVMTSWQRDAKFYQFWTIGNADGSFTLENVRPGSYTLYAFTDGVLGEFNQADVVVEAGKSLDLGTLTWTPVRYGDQLWEVGVANRNASEFFQADQHRDPDIAKKYAELFPDDVTFVIGSSDPAKDWFYAQVPHYEAPAQPAQPSNSPFASFFGVSSNGRATPYTIQFDLASVPDGKVILRAAMCGTAVRRIPVTVNGAAAGSLELSTTDGVVSRHGSQGLWYETDLTFDASLLQAGTNQLVLTVPAGGINNGVLYDYLRLETVK